MGGYLLSSQPSHLLTDLGKDQGIIIAAVVLSGIDEDGLIQVRILPGIHISPITFSQARWYNACSLSSVTSNNASTIPIRYTTLCYRIIISKIIEWHHFISLLLTDQQHFHIPVQYLLCILLTASLSYYFHLYSNLRRLVIQPVSIRSTKIHQLMPQEQIRQLLLLLLLTCLTSFYTLN